MAWRVEDRRSAAVTKDGEAPLLTEPMKKMLAEKYFPRYPTKRAVLLPALHMVQHEHGWIPTRAIAELAEFLQISPAEALDTASFYEEYWLKPKGHYLIQVCRSLACEICGSSRLTEHIRRKLNLDIGQTTPDGRFTLIELECLGACGTAPVMLVNDVLFEDLTPQRIDQILDALPADPHEFKDPTVDWTE
jgi:NADH-quinone oxidoreductase E subunit